jgi:hypothetical protein
METKEEKIQRLRDERESMRLTKNSNAHFLVKSDGNLYVKHYSDPVYTQILHVDMRVKVKKPDNTWRKGIVEYIRIEQNGPVIGVVCGSKRFEKGIHEVVRDNKLEQMIKWWEVEIPDNIKKMPTEKLLRQFRKYIQTHHDLKHQEEIEIIYRAELAQREHFGSTDKKILKAKRRDKKNNG